MRTESTTAVWLWGGHKCPEIDGYPHAVSWKDGAITDLGLLVPGYSYARGVNDSGQIAGYYQVSSTNTTQACVWQNGAVATLGTLGGVYSSAYAINDAGQVVGGSNTSDKAMRAFRWQDGTMTNLGVLPGDVKSWANGISSLGEVVGYSEAPNTYRERAFLWQDGVMSDLGVLPGFFHSMASGINQDRQVVGRLAPLQGDSHAFLWQDGTMYDLNNLLDSSGTGWTLRAAYSINESGWIVGEAYKAQVGTRAFVLTPVPEPSSLLAILSGVAGLVATMRRRGFVSRRITENPSI